MELICIINILGGEQRLLSIAEKAHFQKIIPAINDGSFLNWISFNIGSVCTFKVTEWA